MTHDTGAAAASPATIQGHQTAANPSAAPAAQDSSSSAPSALSLATAQTQPPDTEPLDSDTVAVAQVGAAPVKNQPAYSTTALNLLATLPVKGRAPKTGYSRDQFGQAWADVDHNGCDTRNDILRRDLKSLTVKPGTHNCVILTGTLHDPYTATIIPFQRGVATSSAVQIDHVVALSDAWQTGAQQLTPGQRTSLGNDPLNLLAVDGPANLQKSDSDAASWLPANKSYRCPYVARQISVKATYKLWVTAAEHDAMARILANCANTLAPTNQSAPVVVAPIPAPAQPAQPAQPAPAAPVQAVPAPAPAPAPPVAQPAPAPPVAQPAPAPAPAPSSVYYKNCTAVRAAGAAPIHVGEPGYSSKLDRDGDGVGCE
ncbi:DUF1524 domain-containing protein [Paenarthrobacter sp. Z7-10]|nr:DUF1524 domain-containing protein [Paenarthrobacter sp. Z7-10]